MLKAFICWLSNQHLARLFAAHRALERECAFLKEQSKKNYELHLEAMARLEAKHEAERTVWNEERRHFINQILIKGGAYSMEERKAEQPNLAPAEPFLPPRQKKILDAMRKEAQQMAAVKAGSEIA